MNWQAKLAAAALIGLGVVSAAPAWSQDSGPTLRTPPAPLAAPQSDGGAASEGMTTPGEADNKTDAERNGSTPPPAYGGCPLFNRKLELIV